MAEAPPVSLSELLDRYRSRILQLNRNMLTKLLESESISPDSTDPADIKRIERKEWFVGRRISAPNFPPSVRTPNDIYPLLSNGTSPPLPQEKREELFQQIEDALNAQAAPEFRPLHLPEDFKELCELTDSLEGAGLPQSHNDQAPDAFNGLSVLLFSLQGKFKMSRGPLSVQEVVDDTYMDDSGWKIAAGMQVGLFEGRAGMWLCLCTTEDEAGNPDSANWKWRWCGKNDVETVMFEDVRELLGEFWDQWRGIEYVYGELDYANIS